ncbi:MAG TPA: hypothetical protein VGI42_05245 [Chthoniobacterales bacterium]|jgi:hypothetical protein
MVKSAFAWMTLLLFGACSTLENRRDLYSPNATVTASVAKVARPQTAARSTAVEFRPHPMAPAETPQLPEE